MLANSVWPHRQLLTVLARLGSVVRVFLQKDAHFGGCERPSVPPYEMRWDSEQGAKLQSKFKDTIGAILN